MKRFRVDGPQPLERAALACVLPLELRQRHVRQQVTVAGDPAHRRLDRVPSQRCLEIFVEKGFELGFGCDALGLCVHADHSEDEESCKDEWIERVARVRIVRRRYMRGCALNSERIDSITRAVLAADSPVLGHFPPPLSSSTMVWING